MTIVDKQAMLAAMSDPTVEWVTVTPELAVEWLTRNHGNRHQRNTHIRALATDMRNGQYLVTGDTIKFDTDKRLIDGQHRLVAIYESEVPQRLLVVSGLDPKVQQVVDTQAKRSAANALEFAFGEQARNTNTVAATARLDLTVGAAFARGQVPHALMSAQSPRDTWTNTQVCDWVADNMDVLEASKHGANVSKSPEIALPPRHATWLFLKFSRVSPDDAVKFFSAITDLRFTGQYDPRAVFRLTMNRMSAEERTSMRPLVFGVRAWNVWAQGREMRLLRPTNGGGQNGSTGRPMTMDTELLPVKRHGQPVGDYQSGVDNDGQS